MDIQVNDFITNSELATFKNDTSGTVFSVTIPNGLVFNPSSPTLGIDSKNIGTINAGIRCIAETSKYPGKSVGYVMLTDHLVNIAGIGNYAITIYCQLTRVSSGVLRLSVFCETVFGAPNHTSLESQTITFTVSTFLSPFD